MKPIFNHCALTTLPILLAINLLTAQTDKHEPGRVSLKWKEAYRAQVEQQAWQTAPFAALWQKIPMQEVRKNFPVSQKPEKAVDALGRPLEDLSLIYEIYFQKSYDVFKAIRALEGSGLVEWACPRYHVQPMFTPNDPQLGQQYHLGLIGAFQAWDITQGDTNVVIAITDGGIQFDHPDLAANVHYNYNDPINGIDDDNDGYIDNFRGWNTGSHNNNPTASTSAHGIFTSGMSNAVVNNGVGIAGLGFKTKFMTIRIDNEAGSWVGGYEGIVYAADKGVPIINASWGSFTPTPLARAAINYAVINKGCLVVAAAGNNGNETKVYPASYPGVYAVGGTRSNDLKWGNSQYNYSVDIVAPAENLRSTWAFNGYTTSSGTSFAAPLVSAAAALLKAHQPALSGEQLGERLKVTADTGLFALPGNAAFLNKMGSGRLHVHRALTDPAKPSVYLVNPVFTNQSDQFFVPGDTLTLRGDFLNYLAPASALHMRATSLSAGVQVLDTVYTIGALPSMQLQAFTQGIRLVLPESMAYNEVIAIKLSFSEPGYRGHQVLELMVNQDFRDLATSKLSATITSKGNLGYNRPFALEGNGIRYQLQQSVYDAGLMLGHNGKVMDNTYGATLPNYDSDFVRTTAVQKSIDGYRHQIECAYSDAGAAANAIGLQVFQRSHCSQEAGKENRMFFEYQIINIGSDTLHHAFAGLFFDWDLDNAQQNLAQYDSTNRMVLAYAANGGHYRALQLLSGQNAHAYCFNGDGVGGSINYYDGFSAAEKFAALSGAQTRSQSTVGDVATLLALALPTMAPGDTAAFRFMLLASDSLAGLYAEALQYAREVFAAENQFALAVETPACHGLDGALMLSALSDENKTLTLSQANGEVLLVQDGSTEWTLEALPAGSYILHIALNDSVFVIINATIEQPELLTVSIAAAQTLLYLPQATAQLTATPSVVGGSFVWSIDGVVQNHNLPTFQPSFTAEGSYTIALSYQNGPCMAADSLIINVLDTITTHQQSLGRAGWQVYPNPAQEGIFISGLPVSAQQGLLQFFDIQGRCIDTQIVQIQGQEQVYISLSDKADGCYWLRWLSMEDIKVWPVVVKR